MTTKELQEIVLSNRKKLYRGRTYFYLFFDEDRQIGFPIIFNHNKYCNFRIKFRGLCFSTDYSWIAFYCVDNKGEEVYSAYFDVSDKDFLKEAIECFTTREAELIVSLKQGRIFSDDCCFANFDTNFSNMMFFDLEEFLEITGQPDC